MDKEQIDSAVKVVKDFKGFHEQRTQDLFRSTVSLVQESLERRRDHNGTLLFLGFSETRVEEHCSWPVSFRKACWDCKFKRFKALI